MRRRAWSDLVLVGAAVLSLVACSRGADGVAQGSGEPSTVDRSSLYGAEPSVPSADGVASSGVDDPLVAF